MDREFLKSQGVEISDNTTGYELLRAYQCIYNKTMHKIQAIINAEAIKQREIKNK